MSVQDADQFIVSARRTIQLEQAAISLIAENLQSGFSQACEILLRCQGRVVVTGMGKSGHIAGKIAATLASTGTPAFFVHSGEASHGDMGMITDKDVVLALSNSGTTPEIVTLLPLIKRLGCPLISMTGDPSSTLARESDINLNISIEQEACPLGLAPTSSTTASLVMGDALAIALLEARGFSAEDFAFSHPGGALGRKLLLKVDDLMHSGERLPVVGRQTPISEALLEVSRKGLGMTAVVDDQGKLCGVFTDGDLRRTLDQQVDMKNTAIAEVMTVDCTTVVSNILAAEALHVMQEKKINGLIVIDPQQRPVGALNMHDLLSAGVF